MQDKDKQTYVRTPSKMSHFRLTLLTFLVLQLSAANPFTFWGTCSYTLAEGKLIFDLPQAISSITLLWNLNSNESSSLKLHNFLMKMTSSNLN